MIRAEFKAPGSGGRLLESGTDALGALIDSSCLLGNPDALRARLTADGYLYLKKTAFAFR